MNDKISRRSALKRLGMLAAGAMAASTGLFSAAACAPGTKKRVVLYFTGTGNCLYIARQLAGKDGETLSIPQLMRKKQYDIEADEIGIVYPLYGHMPPNMVRRFIAKAHLKAQYTFAILTYGMRKCNAVEIWDAIARKAGTKFDYINTLIMVDNWLPNFDMIEQMKLDKHIPENLAKIQSDLANRRQWHEPVTQEEREQHEGFMQRSGLDPEKGFLWKAEETFIISGACVTCGICAHVCPRGNYSVTKEGVRMEGQCEVCFACIQNCPQKAILFSDDSPSPLLADGEKNPDARYRNEHISIMDLKLANDVSQTS